MSGADWSLSKAVYRTSFPELPIFLHTICSTFQISLKRLVDFRMKSECISVSRLDLKFFSRIFFVTIAHGNHGLTRRRLKSWRRS